MKKLGKKKLIMIGGVLIVLLGAAYTMSSPKPKVVLKVKGTLYALPKSFLINLSGGQYAKINVALLLSPGQSAKPEGEAASGSGSGEEAGTLPEEVLVRSIITDVITGQRGETLIEERGRTALQKKILNQIDQKTDVKVESVLFPDLAVQ